MPVNFTPEQLVEHSKDLTALPEIYIRVSGLLQDPDASNKDIGDLIRTDPSLTARVLRVANSPVFMSLMEINSVNVAVSMMGRKSIRQLLLASVSNSVFESLEHDVFPMKDYWYHSLRTGLIAQQLYRLCEGDHEPEALFTAGLLHDIGKHLIAQQLPEQAQRIYLATKENPMKRLQMERELLGFTHAEVGAALLKHWNLPLVLQVPVRWHHEPIRVSNFHQEVWSLALANVFAKLENLHRAEILERVLSAFNGWQQIGLTEPLILEALLEAEAQREAVIQAFSE